MTVNKSLLGLSNRNAGHRFEDIISIACRYYAEHDIAVIEKTPEPMRPLKPYGARHMGQFVAIYEKQAQPDFKGVLMNGRGIIFEAKHTDGDRINRSVVTEVQEKNFNIYEKMGAICFVMVSMGFQEFYRIPWNVFSDMKSLFGRKYMKKEELEPYKVPEKYGNILFLEGLDIEERTGGYGLVG